MIRRILIITSYTLVVAGLVLATVLLVAYGRGYSYDFRTRRLTLNGLIIMNSVPSGADVLRAGRDIHRKTPYRATLETGSYPFEVIRDGYRPWAKMLAVAASEVTWVQYIFLFPTDIKLERVASAPAIGGLSVSRDHHQAAYITGGPEASVWRYDFGNKQTTKLYTPKSATAEVPAEAVSSVVWSNDNSHVLIKTVLAEKPVYYLVSANGNEVTNLTEVYKFDFDRLSFSPTNWRELYWVSPEGLRKLDVGARSVSAVLAENVISFAYGGDRVIYVQKTGLGRSVWSLNRGGHKQELVQSVAESESYDIDFATYKNEDLLAIVPRQAHTLTLYRRAFGAAPLAQVISKVADQAQFNGDGRFLYYESAGASAYTLDLEKSSVDKLAIHPISGLKAPITSVSWFDNYHLLMVLGSKATVIEFDGGNATDIATVIPGQAAYAAPDQKSIVLVQSEGTANGATLHQLMLALVKK